MIEQIEQVKKIGNERITRERYISPEGPRRIITKEGLVKYGEELQSHITKEAKKVKTDARTALEHIAGKSPENIAFMKESGTEQKLVATASEIDALATRIRAEIKTLTDFVDI